MTFVGSLKVIKMSNFFISIGFVITAIQIFASKKIARAYDSADYSLMGDFYLFSGAMALVGAILFFLAWV